MAPPFICPNCGTARRRPDRTAGFRNQPKGCSKCGFGFLFELLDDYYPAPNAAVLRLRPGGPIIGCGRGSKELTGLSDEKVIGRSATDVLGLDFDGARDTVATVPRWGSPADKPVTVRRRAISRQGRRGPVPGLRRRRRAAADPHAEEVAK
jgi:PAS domain-containing protein